MHLEGSAFVRAKHYFALIINFPSVGDEGGGVHGIIENHKVYI